MKKTVYVCDKCERDIEESKITQIFGKDLCEECSEEAEEVFMKWLKPRKPGGSVAKIDWSKCCALKLAGWNNKDIAREVGANEGTINSMIYKKLDEYKKGERWDADDRPSEESDI